MRIDRGALRRLARGIQHDPGDGVEAAAHIGADSRVAQDERLGLDARVAVFPPLFLRSRQRGQRLVQSISRRALRGVEHDHVDAQTAGCATAIARAAHRSPSPDRRCLRREAA